MGNKNSTQDGASKDTVSGKEITIHSLQELGPDHTVDALICFIDTKWSNTDPLNSYLTETGGNQFTSERKALQHSHDNCNVGDIFVCNGGRLPCNKVFFCALPEQPEEDTASAPDNGIDVTLATIFESVLESSAKSRLSSLAIPFGGGNLCPHPSRAIPLVYLKFMMLNSSVVHIHLVTMDQSVVGLMRTVLMESHQSVPKKIQEDSMRQSQSKQLANGDSMNGLVTESAQGDHVIPPKEDLPNHVMEGEDDDNVDDNEDEDHYNNFGKPKPTPPHNDWTASASGNRLNEPSVSRGASKLPTDLDEEEDLTKCPEKALLNPWSKKSVTFSSEVTERHLDASETPVEFKRTDSNSSDCELPLDFDNLRVSGAGGSQNTQSPREVYYCAICMQEKTIGCEKKLDKCQHVFCKDCINQHFKQTKACPLCNTPYGDRIGSQPENALMSYKLVTGSLPGYEGSNTIVIEYDVPNGIQTEEHPNPGQPYKGTQRTAYLPNTPDGQRIHKLLKKAFDQRLIFTIGRSLTTGKENVVTWSDIHHKTNVEGGPQRFGYPDPTYLRRVYEEIMNKGLTED